MDEKAAMLRHFLGVLAYRTQKAVRGAPDEFGDFSPGNQVRTPRELVRHMTSVLGYARTYFIGGKYWPDELPSLSAELERFHEMLALLKGHFEAGDTLGEGMTAESLLQGPFSDALSHAGQLAMLRRLFGDPVPPENFIVASVDGSNVSADQPEPMSPDEVWPECPEGSRRLVRPRK